MTGEHAHCSCGCSGGSDLRYQQLEKIIAEYKGKPGALIPVLHKAQGLFGYLAEDVQELVAEGLAIPLSEVYGVITFYSLFSTKPRGEHTIGVCMGTACYVKGAADILKTIKTQLGIEIDDTSADGLFTLTVTRCLGACGLAPVLTIDEDVYGRLTPDKIPDILNKYRQSNAK
ncbi:MAG TPA: NAD(P)H-dependent oxidoreductase subunit E [Firmicutes bacterium]|jgi:NADH:ubiquinone oxidoreductase subunit E|nr:NAD(P)H-dependent oxidoreductase subunit E [Bacillota bacterium]